jgi:hypothetical protein
MRKLGYWFHDPLLFHNPVVEESPVIHPESPESLNLFHCRL